MSLMFNIFQKPSFDDFIRRVEQRTYYPYVNPLGNRGIVKNTVNQSDPLFLLSESSISIDGKIERIKRSGQVSLSGNAAAYEILDE